MAVRIRLWPSSPTQRCEADPSDPFKDEQSMPTFLSSTPLPGQRLYIPLVDAQPREPITRPIHTRLDVPHFLFRISKRRRCALYPVQLVHLPEQPGHKLFSVRTLSLKCGVAARAVLCLEQCPLRRVVADALDERLRRAELPVERRVVQGRVAVSIRRGEESTVEGDEMCEDVCVKRVGRSAWRLVHVAERRAGAGTYRCARSRRRSGLRYYRWRGRSRLRCWPRRHCAAERIVWRG